jgi:seryl-tRNA synthetase
MRGLERLWDFTMREVIWVGEDEYVHEQRQRAISLSAHMLDKWGLSYQIKTATDPFFIDSYGMQAAFQRAFDLKFEVLAPLPYKGANSYLAIGSFNFHQEFFGRAFDIKTTAGEAASTGCLGFGLERVALAFLAQHGIDPLHWPDAVAKAYQSN